MKRHSVVVLAAVAAILSTKTASAAIVQLSEDAFMAGAGLITFSEVPLGTENPVFAPSDYGGDATAPTVSTGGFFTGFSLGHVDKCLNQRRAATISMKPR